MRLRRARFADVIERQLDQFAEHDAEYLDDVDRALDRYNAAERDDAEELYGDYQLAIEAATDRLAEMRDAFGATMDDAQQYEREFNQAVIRRWPALSLTIEESEKSSKPLANAPTIAVEDVGADVAEQAEAPVVPQQESRRLEDRGLARVRPPRPHSRMDHRQQDVHERAAREQRVDDAEHRSEDDARRAGREEHDAVERREPQPVEEVPGVADHARAPAFGREHRSQ